jgi:hypothetical protein
MVREMVNGYRLMPACLARACRWQAGLMVNGYMLMGNGELLMANS